MVKNLNFDYNFKNEIIKPDLSGQPHIYEG